MRTAKQWMTVMAMGVMGVASSASAGSTFQYAYCAANADGSGYCSGNFLGFRNHAGSGTQVYFNHTDWNTKSFRVDYQASSTAAVQTFMCTPSSAVAALWSSAMSHSGYFNIEWDAAGICTRLQLYHGSQYSNF
jgi:hypothetical protein